VRARTAEWTASTAYTRLIEALEAARCRVEGAGRQRRAQCPHHPDAKPSLGITDGSSRVLLICRAGCDTADILADLGLTLRDLFDADGEPGPRADSWAPWWRDGCKCPPVAYYPYTDEAGKLLYEHVRGTHKEFSFRRPDPLSRSGWRWNLEGVRRVLYRLPEVVNAPSNAAVFVTEGESDADALASAGEVATTTDSGALTGSGRKQWLPEWSEALQGREVLVAADRDAPGRVHARHVAASLDGIARFVWIVEAAAGKDVRDHLAAGLTITDLVWWS
jgi:putative DNA primase/helicase